MRGRARLGRRTKELVARLEPGEIAVLDHEDLDEVAARGLVDAKPAAVVNARPVDQRTLPQSRPPHPARGGNPGLGRRGRRGFRVARGRRLWWR